MLTQSGGVPVQIKDVARVSVGFVPRLGIWGHDSEDDAVAGIVVMSRTEKTADMLPKVKAEIDSMNHDGSLPPGVRLVPIYDRGALVDVTTHTVLHNLAFGCLLVFLIQWIFLGDLRSAIIVGVNIPFALLFAIIALVARGESANLLSLGAVDFGIIVESAVILVENVFRNFQAPAAERQGLLQRLAAVSGVPIPIDHAASCDPGTRLDRSSATDPRQRRCRSISAVFFAALIVVAAFVPLFTMQGVEGAIFGPMARTYGYALVGSPHRHLHGDPDAGLVVAPRARGRERDADRARAAPPLRSRAALRARIAGSVFIGAGLVALAGSLAGAPARQ